MSKFVDALEQSLQESVIFSKLTEEERQAIQDLFYLKEVKKNGIVFHQGDQNADLHYLVEGRLKSVSLMKDGKEIFLHMINPNELFAIVPAYLDEPYTGTSVALEKSLIGKIKRKDFLEILKQYPDIALKMMGIMAVRTKSLLVRLEEQIGHSTIERLVGFILNESHRQQAQNFILPLSKVALASSLGTIPETISRCFQKLSKKKYIAYSGKNIQILNESSLIQILNKEISL